MNRNPKRGQEMTHESIEAIFSKMTDTLVKKNQDYHGASFDLGATGVYVHLHDKLTRYHHLAVEQAVSNFESTEDSLMDIIGYAVIGLHILKQEKEEKENEK